MTYEDNDSNIFFYYEVHKVMCDMCDFMFDVVIISYVIMTWEIEWWWYSKPTVDSALLYLQWCQLVNAKSPPFPCTFNIFVIFL